MSEIERFRGLSSVYSILPNRTSPDGASLETEASEFTPLADIGRGILVTTAYFSCSLHSSDTIEGFRTLGRFLLSLSSTGIYLMNSRSIRFLSCLLVTIY